MTGAVARWMAAQRRGHFNYITGGGLIFPWPPPLYLRQLTWEQFNDAQRLCKIHAGPYM